MTTGDVNVLEGRLSGGSRLVRAVALALGACVLATGSAAAAEVPDPLAPGPYGYKKIEYNAGNLMITIPPTNGGASQTFSIVDRAGLQAVGAVRVQAQTGGGFHGQGFRSVHTPIDDVALKNVTCAGLVSSTGIEPVSAP